MGQIRAVYQFWNRGISPKIGRQDKGIEVESLMKQTEETNRGNNMEALLTTCL